MSATPEAGPRLYTGADLERLSDAGYRYELIRGELREMAPAGGRHGGVNALIALQLEMYIVKHRAGRFFSAETGFYLGRNPDTVLAPDWSFVTRNRVPRPLPDSYMEVMADVVMETRSPSQTRGQVQDKIEQWLAVGVRVVIDVDPRSENVNVHRAGASTVTFGRNDVLTIEDVFPGLEIALEQVFDAPDD